MFVDDIIITGPNSSTVCTFITSLANRLSLKDLDTLSYFPGTEVLSHSDGLFLSQTKYILDILTKANMSHCKPASNPSTTSTHLNTTDGKPISNPKDYRSLVGGLQYLSLTHPDVAFFVNKLPHFMHCPTDLHWTALKRLTIPSQNHSSRITYTTQLPITSSCFH